MTTTIASSSRARSDNLALYRTRSSSQSLSSGFASSTAFLTRSSSPTRVTMYGGSSSPSSRSVRFAVDRTISPGRRSMSVTKQRNGGAGNGNGNGTVSKQRKTCMCSPTTHPGSFRCSLHKSSPRGGGLQTSSLNSNSRRLNLMRSAMVNSLIRIGVVEGDLMKRSLSALIRPSSHQQRRRAAFQPRPSRLSVMSRAEDP
ncbi:hypothetical protein L484_025705 [Morus notabilis]|uniref:Serine-rich protein n=1 Tax=Morus notabilis TaxID=981085 RepID=W9R3M8_9ROSA|nr:uncharacterized protein LOC21408391 [Morus notabilis]EXB67227.1 hypothetical protein L484_025705 [Morus notabilis]